MIKGSKDPLREIFKIFMRGRAENLLLDNSNRASVGTSEDTKK